MYDSFSRPITYLRVSVTDRCDFRCVYCMAEEMTFVPKPQILTLEELEQEISAEVQRIITTLPGRIHFGYDSAEISRPSAELLQLIAQTLIAVLDALDKDHDWQSVTLEPDKASETQVRSTVPTFGV